VWWWGGRPKRAPGGRCSTLAFSKAAILAWLALVIFAPTSFPRCLPAGRVPSSSFRGMPPAPSGLREGWGPSSRLRLSRPKSSIPRPSRAESPAGLPRRDTTSPAFEEGPRPRLRRASPLRLRGDLTAPVGPLVGLIPERGGLPAHVARCRCRPRASGGSLPAGIRLF